MKLLPKGFRQRAVFLALAPAAVIALALTGYFLFLRYDDVEKALSERGQSLVRQLSPAAEYGAFSGNRPELARLVKAAASDREVVAVAIYDANGTVLATVGTPTPIPGSGGSRLHPEGHRRAGSREIFSAAIRHPSLAFEDPFTPPSQAANDVSGTSLGQVVVELSRANLDARKQEILVVTVLTTLVVLVAALLLARRLGRDVVEPVLALEQAVSRIRAGELDVRITPHASGTLASLESGFNEMAAALDAGRRRSAHALAHSEEELARLLDIAQAKREEAERASRDKSRFLAAASHDLRQPLHALSLFAAELLTTASPRQHRLASRIVNAASAMTEMLDALLEVSRLDVAAVRPQRGTVALGPLLESVVDAHRQSAAAKELRLRCHPTSLWADTDPQLLRRMIGNLVGNAVRYTQHGGVLLGARVRGEGIRIEVWDTGIGIDPGHREAIFQEFYQVGNPERDPAKGLGLGLAIVARLGKLLDHPVGVRSVPGRGSVFWILVPRAVPAQGTMTTPLPGPTLGARIGVLTTDIALCSEVCAYLDSWGYQHECLCSADDTRGFLDRQPALLICDAASLPQLPEKTGSPTAVGRILVLGDGPSGDPADLPIAGRIPLPLRPARLRAFLHHLLHEEEEAQALAFDAGTPAGGGPLRT